MFILVNDFCGSFLNYDINFFNKVEFFVLFDIIKYIKFNLEVRLWQSLNSLWLFSFH